MTSCKLQVARGVCRRGLLFLSLVTCCLSLVSCGFHLRGAVELPPQMERTQLAGIDARSALAEEIVAVLEGAGAQVVAADATAVLQIGDERETRRLLSVGSSGRASEYEVAYQFSFELRVPVTATDAAGEERIVHQVRVARQTVNLSRDYTFDPNNVLSMGDVEAVLVREMRSFAVRQMLLRLRAGLQQTQP